MKAKAHATSSYRYYDAVVDDSGAGNASLVYCEDQSNAHDLHVKTKKVDKSRATKNSYVLYSTQLHRNEKSVWIIEKLLSPRGSSKCQP